MEVFKLRLVSTLSYKTSFQIRPVQIKYVTNPRNALKTDQTSIFSDPFASVLLPYIFSSHVGFEYLQLPLGMHQKIVKFGFCVYSWLANLSNFHGSIFPE